MGDTNRTSLKYIKETTWGTTPATHMNDLRMTGESLSFNISNIVSNELRSDRQTTDLVQVSAEASGGFDGELSYAAYDEFFQGALWATPANGWQGSISGATSSTIAFENSGSRIVDSSGTPFSSLMTGQWVRLSGATESANNGYFFITSVTSSSAIVVSQTLTDEVEGDTITIDAGCLRNSTKERSYSIQRAHEDMNPTVYFHFKGMVVNSVTFNVEVEQITTISFDFIGASAIVSGTKLSTTGTDAAAAANDVLNAVSHCANIREGDMTTDETAIIRSVNFTLANNIRGKKGIGDLGNADIGAGKVDVTGTMSVYFTDKNMYDKYVNGTETSLTFKLEDTPSGTTYGNAYIFTFPRIKFESDGVNAGGADADVMEEIGWRAIRHATYDCTIQIDKFAAGG